MFLLFGIFDLHVLFVIFVLTYSKKLSSFIVIEFSFSSEYSGILEKSESKIYVNLLALLLQSILPFSIFFCNIV